MSLFNKLMQIVAMSGFLLAGCGNSYQPTAGDPLYMTAAVDGTEILQQTYRYYTVDNQGNLSATPLDNDESFPHVALLESRTQNPDAKIQARVALASVPFETVKSFYKDLWDTMSEIYPTLSPREITEQIGDLDCSIEGIYDDVQSSGLDLKDYIAFYESLDKYFDDDNIEGDLDNFIYYTGAALGELLYILDSKGASWDELLAIMAVRQATFASLYDGYAKSGLSLDEYLDDYMKDTAAKVAGAIDPAKIAEAGISAAKFAWDVIKDNRPQTKAQGAYTSILSTKDPSWENYGYAKQGASPALSLEYKCLYGWVVMSATVRLTGYYDAVSPNVGGKWLPSVAFTVDKAHALLTYKINASAAITSAVNLASPAEPKPQIEVIYMIRNSGLFQSYIESYTFYANGATGFSRQ